MAEGLEAVEVGAGEQRVVVEHLLEVGHQPARVDGIAREAAADLVVDAAARHGVEGPVTTSVSPRASRNSSDAAGGNFGAPPKPPFRESASMRELSLGGLQEAAAWSGSADGSIRATAPSCSRMRAVASRSRSRCDSHDSTTASMTIRKLGIPWRGSGGK